MSSLSLSLLPLSLAVHWSRVSPPHQGGFARAEPLGAGRSFSSAQPIAHPIHLTQQIDFPDAVALLQPHDSPVMSRKPSPDQPVPRFVASVGGSPARSASPDYPARLKGKTPANKLNVSKCKLVFQLLKI